MRFNKASAYEFKQNDRWYKLSLRIDETNVSPTRDNFGQKSSLNL